jgi:hypothetical protein
VPTLIVGPSVPTSIVVTFAPVSNQNGQSVGGNAVGDDVESAVPGLSAGGHLEIRGVPLMRRNRPGAKAIGAGIEHVPGRVVDDSYQR